MEKLFYSDDFKKLSFKLFQVLMIVCLLQYFAPAKLSAQTVADSAAILQKAINLPQLQQYYPINQNNSTKPLVIMQHGVSFSTTIAVSHNNQPLVFKSKAEIVNEQAYFLFWTFTINDHLAQIECSYNHNMGTPSGAAQKIILTMEKTGNTWNIINTNIVTVQL